MTLFPLPKQTTDEIRLILEGCRNGRLKHDQASFHCATSHCIAGWKEMLDFCASVGRKTTKNVHAYTDRHLNWREKAFEALGITVDFDDDDDNAIWNYAVAKWELTQAEARELFEYHRTFTGQFALLEKLEAGERL